MNFQEKLLKCVECGNEFIYTVAEQELHKSLGYKNQPKRCSSCRNARRSRRNYRKGIQQNIRRTFTIICADCGKEAQIPFKPRGDRPVYCSNCFTRRKSLG